MRHKLQLLDTHAGGDVSRIIIGGIKSLPGVNVRQKMEYLRKNADGLRKTLLYEPYGVPEMSVDLIVPSSHKEAVAGYIIMETMGYPIYSGSNTICVAMAVLEQGIVPKREGKLNFQLESPAGLVYVEASVEKGIVESITCKGLPSYIHTYKDVINVPTIGKVTFSIAYSGGFYALVEAKDFGFKLTIDEEEKLNEHAYKIVEEINKNFSFEHYSLGDVGELPFLHFMADVEKKEEGYYSSRSTTYVHPSVICRSTTGTGTSARLALLNYENKIKIGDKLETVSLRETKFIGEYVSEETIDGNRVVNNTITGKSYVIAESDIFINSDDSMVKCSDLSLIIEEE
jgi:proline racemase